MLRYHFADEAEQIQQLMLPVPPRDGESERRAAGPRRGGGRASRCSASTSRRSASAAARQWGLGEDVLHMIRRLPVDVPVRKPDNDDELLRIVASAANEAVDALEPLPPTKVGGGAQRSVAATRARCADDADLHDAHSRRRSAAGKRRRRGCGKVESAPITGPRRDAADGPARTARRCRPRSGTRRLIALVASDARRQSTTRRPSIAPSAAPLRWTQHGRDELAAR